jgi:dihydropteroate synthase
MARPRLLDLGSAGIAAEFARMGVDPRGAARMGDKARHMLVRFERVGLRAAHLLKQDMLALGGDAALAREAAALEVEETPVLLMGTVRQLAALAEKAEHQPFGTREAGRATARLIGGGGRARFVAGRRDLLRKGRVLVMGILNCTPDSFHDGGLNLHPAEAVAAGLRMVREGADIIDVGGESTRPGAQRVSAREEARRVVPVVRELRRRGVKAVSVDTTRASVAAAALEAGAAIVNDVSGFAWDRGMARTVARAGASAIIMHTRGTPDDMRERAVYADLMGEVHAELARSLERAASAGIPAERLAVDPGLGFAKTPAHCFEILARLAELRSLGCAVAVGASRKSFLGEAVLGRAGGDAPARRLEGSLAAAALAVLAGADILRVHDVPATVRAAAVAREVRRWKD